MIIIRNKYFSEGKKKSDEETEKQKRDRRSVAIGVGTLVGVPTAAIASGISEGIIQNKEQEARKKLDKLYDKHRAPIGEKYEKVMDGLKKRSEEIEKAINDKYSKEYSNDIRERLRQTLNKGEDQRKRLLAEFKLRNEVLNRESAEVDKLLKARGRLLKRIERKANKTRIKGVGSALAIGSGLGIAAGVGVNKSIKKHNKKVNKVRRHIED